jgi:hypothetical protein
MLSALSRAGAAGRDELRAVNVEQPRPPVRNRPSVAVLAVSWHIFAHASVCCIKYTPGLCRIEISARAHSNAELRTVAG